MQPGDVFADRFEIERFAGAGGMGTVYRVLDRKSGGEAALKVLDGERTATLDARFEREARLLSELHHPGIVRYLDHGVTPAGEPYLVMEWLSGEELAERLLRGPLSIDDAITLGRRVSEALSAAHERGILHRDINPKNLFLSEGAVELVKVLDFGIARVERAPQPVTRTGAVLGTVGFMAPEQARGEPDADARVDVFSLGCVLFQALTGRAPFEGQHVLAVLAKILIEDAPRVAELRPDVPPELDDLVARMLAKDPAERPLHGGAVALELGAIEEPVTRRTAPPGASPSEHVERGAGAERAAVVYGEAAEQALEANDLDAVIGRAERGVASGAKGEALGRLRLLQAEAYRWRGESDEAARAANQALAEAARGSVLWCAAASEASASAMRQSDPDALARIALDLCAVADEAGFDAPGIVTSSSLMAAQIIACARVASPLFIFGRHALGERLLARIERAPAELLRRDPLLRARVFEARALRAACAGDPGAFIVWSREAVGGFVEVGDIRNAAVQLSNLALAQSWLGGYAVAEEDLLDVLALGERMGLSSIVCAARQNLGYVFARQGRLEEAIELEVQSLEAAKTQGDRRLEAGARIYLAISAELKGDRALSEREATAAVEMLTRKVPLRAYALGVLSQIKRSVGRPAQSLAIAEEAVSLLESLGGAIEEGEATVRLAYAEALRDNRHPKAAEAIAVARKRIEERAAQISDPEWRESFLARVPENARTLALAELPLPDQVLSSGAP